jgi:hypothetical protein
MAKEGQTELAHPRICFGMAKKLEKRGFLRHLCDGTAIAL